MKFKRYWLFGFLVGSFGFLYYAFSLIPQDLPQHVFFFDAQDIDATGDSLNELPNNTTLTWWIDKFRWIVAFQHDLLKTPLYVLTSINIYPSIYFWGSRFYNVLEDWNISLSWDYPQKSFVMIFKTSGDVISFQSLYDEGTDKKWFWIYLISWHILGGVRNVVDWTGQNIAIVDMGAITGNNIYTLALVFNSLSWFLAGYVDGNLESLVTGLDVSQTNHWACRFDTSFGCTLFDSWWSFAIGAIKNWWFDLINETWVDIFEWKFFKWYIWEIQTYNYALTQSEISGITLYLFEKWWIDKTPPRIISASITSGALLPGRNHNLKIFYSDSHPASVGINTWSARLDILKWESWSWRTLYSWDIPYVAIDTWEVDYDLSLTFGKYLLDFKIADNAGNYTWRKAQIRIDEPQLVISTWIVNFGGLNLGDNVSSLIVKVYTVWAPFQVYVVKQQDLTYDWIILPDYSWWVGWWVRAGADILPLSIEKLIMSWVRNINQNGELNTYTWEVDLDILIDDSQPAWIYSWFIKFNIRLSY